MRSDGTATPNPAEINIITQLRKLYVCFGWLTLAPAPPGNPAGPADPVGPWKWIYRMLRDNTEPQKKNPNKLITDLRQNAFIYSKNLLLKHFVVISVNRFYTLEWIFMTHLTVQNTILTGGPAGPVLPSLPRAPCRGGRDYIKHFHI